MNRNEKTTFRCPVLFIVLLAGTILSSIIGCSSSQEKTEIGAITDIEMTLDIDPAKHWLEATGRIKWISNRADTVYFLMNDNLEVSLSGNDNISESELNKIKSGEEIKSYLGSIHLDTTGYESIDHLALYRLPIQTSNEFVQFDLKYAGEIYDDVEVASFSRWEIADETTGIIDEQGAFLPVVAGFYPRLPGDNEPVSFTTTLILPDNWDGLAEGKIVLDEGNSTTFDSEHPIDGTYVVAGPYKTRTINSGNSEIAMYYYEGSEDLVGRYLHASADYIQRYNKLLGEYAFSRFSVVENWFPTGYGMPTYTLLGSRVIRLPFIIGTSLGHEVCHNWWGNGVYVDWSSGNWCEGLTTYCADYLYKVEESEEAAKQYRRDINRDYSDYVVRGDDTDFPLREFQERTTAGSRTIGYGKSMMVFHMVHQKIGDDKFWNILSSVYENQKFTKAAWNDFFAAFEKETGLDFGWFETQWIDKAGAPAFAVENVSVSNQKEKSVLEFDLKQVQDTNIFRLDVPVRINYDDGTIYNYVLRDVNEDLYHAAIEVTKGVDVLEIDPDMHLFRELDPREAPATLAGFFADESPVIVIPDSDGQMKTAYNEFAESMNRKGTATVLTESEVTPELLGNESVLWLGKKEQVATETNGKYSFNGEIIDGDGLAIVSAFRDSDDPNIVHLEVWAESPSALSPLARKLPHYGKYSYLAFSQGRAINKGHWPVYDSPLRVAL